MDPPLTPPSEDVEVNLVVSSTDDDQSPTTTIQNTEHEEDAHPLDTSESASASVPVTSDDTSETQKRQTSTRIKKKSAWMTGGDYQINQQHIVTKQVPEWKLRADYLQSLSQTGVFNSVNTEVAQTLLNIVSGKS